MLQHEIKLANIEIKYQFRPKDDKNGQMQVLRHMNVVCEMGVAGRLQ
jgi:hypothetical protein